MATGEESKSPFELDSVKLRSLYKDGADMVEDRRAELMSWFKDFGLATVVDEDGFTVTKVGDPPSPPKKIKWGHLAVAWDDGRDGVFTFLGVKVDVSDQAMAWKSLVKLLKPAQTDTSGGAGSGSGGGGGGGALSVEEVEVAKLFMAKQEHLKRAQKTGKMSSGVHRVCDAADRTIIREGAADVVYADLGLDIADEDLGAAITVEDLAAVQADWDTVAAISRAPPSDGGGELGMYAPLARVLKHVRIDAWVYDGSNRDSHTYALSGKPDLVGAKLSLEVKKVQGRTGEHPNAQVPLLKYTGGDSSGDGSADDAEAGKVDEGDGGGGGGGGGGDGLKSTEGPYQLNCAAWAQVFAQSDAEMWASFHTPRIVALTDGEVWRFGIHVLDSKRNLFLVDEHYYRELPAALTVLRRMHRWVGAQAECDGCTASPALHRPPKWRIDKEELERQALTLAMGDLAAFFRVRDAPPIILDSSDPDQFKRAKAFRDRTNSLNASFDYREADLLRQVPPESLKRHIQAQVDAVREPLSMLNTL